MKKEITMKLFNTKQEAQFRIENSIWVEPAPNEEVDVSWEIIETSDHKFFIKIYDMVDGEFLQYYYGE
jgi:hypothetical protein